MKTIIYVILAAIILTGCNKAEEPSTNGIIDDSNIVDLNTEIICTTISESEATTEPVFRDVLLENFTGYKCVGCPPANEISLDLIEIYEDRINVVTVHCTNTFAAPNINATYPEPFSQDFRTVDSEIYVSPSPLPFGVELLPSGLINRAFYDESLVVPLWDWQGILPEIINDESDIKMDINDASFSNDSISIDLTLEFLNDLEGDFYITIALVENEVISAQAYAGEIVLDYVQRNVFRGNLNDTWGDLVKTDPDLRDFVQVIGTYPLPAKFVEPGVPNPDIEIDDCHIVAYIYKSDIDNDMFKVEQVKKALIGF